MLEGTSSKVCHTNPRRSSLIFFNLRIISSQFTTHPHNLNKEVRQYDWPDVHICMDNIVVHPLGVSSNFMFNNGINISIKSPCKRSEPTASKKDAFMPKIRCKVFKVDFGHTRAYCTTGDDCTDLMRLPSSQIMSRWPRLNCMDGSSTAEFEIPTAVQPTVCYLKA